MFSWLWRFTKPDISKHLLEDEVLVEVVTWHWLAFRKTIALLAAAVLVVVLGVVAFPVGGWFFLLLTAGLLAWAYFQFEDKYTELVMVTDVRAAKVNGWIGEHRSTIPLSRLVDISVDRSFLGQVLGYGHITLHTASEEQGLRKTLFVRNIDEFERKAIRMFMRERDQRRVGRGGGA